MSAHIKFLDLNKQIKPFNKALIKNVISVIKSKKFILKDEVLKFEKSFSLFSKIKYCAGVSSGTSALFLALKALNIQSGDEVIIPANTFIATAEAVVSTGAKVCLCDVEEETYNISCNKILKLINDKTKAIIVVNLYGNPFDVKSLKKIINNKKIKIIEDSAQSHGARINNNQIGKFSDVSCFSFYPGKNLGAFGDAGAVLSNNKYIIDKVKLLRDHGRSKKYDHKVIGYNARMDDIQACVLNTKLKYLSKWNAKRHELAKIYNMKLKNLSQVTTPVIKENYYHVFHLYVIRVKHRNKLQNFLKKHGIDTGIHYPISLSKISALSANRQACKKKDCCFNHCSVSEKFSKEILSLPIYPELKHKEINYIVNKIKIFYEKKN